MQKTILLLLKIFTLSISKYKAKFHYQLIHYSLFSHSEYYTTHFLFDIQISVQQYLYIILLFSLLFSSIVHSFIIYYVISNNSSYNLFKANTIKFNNFILITIILLIFITICMIYLLTSGGITLNYIKVYRKILSYITLIAMVFLFTSSGFYSLVKNFIKHDELTKIYSYIIYMLKPVSAFLRLIRILLLCVILINFIIFINCGEQYSELLDIIYSLPIVMLSKWIDNFWFGRSVMCITDNEGPNLQQSEQTETTKKRKRNQSPSFNNQEAEYRKKRNSTYMEDKMARYKDLRKKNFSEKDIIRILNDEPKGAWKKRIGDFVQSYGWSVFRENILFTAVSEAMTSPTKVIDLNDQVETIFKNSREYRRLSDREKGLALERFRAIWANEMVKTKVRLNAIELTMHNYAKEQNGIRLTVHTQMKNRYITPAIYEAAKNYTTKYISDNYTNNVK